MMNPLITVLLITDYFPRGAPDVFDMKNGETGRNVRQL
jgi:hypothetical protein